MLSKIEVKDHMTTRCMTLTLDMDVMEAIEKLLKKRITGAPVLDFHGQIVGMFTELDCMKVVLDAAYNQDFGGTVEEYMTRDTPTVDCETSIVEVAEKFSTTEYRNFPVVEDVDLVGVISRTDVLTALTSIR